MLLGLHRLSPERTRRLSRRDTLAALAGVMVTAQPPTVRAAQPFRFGLTPVFLNSDLDLLEALQKYLSAAMGTEVQLVLKRTYQEITSQLLSGLLDAAWICGFPFIAYRRELELVAVPIWRGKTTYQSYLIVSEGREASTITDLRGDIHAFSDPDSNSGYLVTRALLAENGVKPQDFFQRTFFTYGHRNVVSRGRWLGAGQDPPGAPMNLGRRRLVLAAAALTLIIAAASGIFVATRRGVPSSPVLSGLAFQTADGRELMGAAFQGRFVLLNVWATWCPPCVKDMPSLDRLQAMKGDSSFEVVALSIDRQGLEVVAPFFKRMGLSNLAIYLDREARSMPALRITGLPTTVLIDPSGREVARWPGAREWDERSTVSEIEEHIAKAGKSTR